MGAIALNDGRITICRDRNGYSVRATDPEIEKSNRSRKDSPWQDPSVEYNFKTKDQVLDFVGKAIDIALPEDAYTSAFDKLAKEAQSS